MGGKNSPPIFQMIYDCFMFNNELMLLEIRLNELNPFIDRFILVEAAHTFSGEPKKLYYEQVKDSDIFAPFKDKIIHCVYNEIPNSDRWHNEEHQRNYADRILVDVAKPDDLIIVSDIDEIINVEVFPVITSLQIPAKLMMKNYYYFFNCRSNQMWAWSAVCRYKDYHWANFLRNAVYYNQKNYHKIAVTNAGWHYGYLMNAKGISQKIGDSAHKEYDTEYFRNIERIQSCIDSRSDLFERRNLSYSIEEFDGPVYIKGNIGKYKEFIVDTSSNPILQE